jgi:hypothetical protein
MNDAPNSLPQAYDDGIDLWELWDTVWSGRWLIIAITALFAVGGVTYALNAQQWWRAEVVLAPADRRSAPGALSQLGGLASLAGVNIGTGGNQEPLAVLKSRGFVRDFITEQNLMPVLFKDFKSPDGKAPDIGMRRGSSRPCASSPRTVARVSSPSASAGRTPIPPPIGRT